MKRIGFALLALLLLVSCSDDSSSKFSKKYQVRFYFEVQQSAELFNAIGNPGQFVSIRPLNGKVRIHNTMGGHDYSLSSVGSRDFEYGLGGLIVGTSSTPNMNGGFDLVAYDLACPNCDRQSRRLTLKDDGSAFCEHCGISYDMNNYGWLLHVDENAKSELRSLYRYHINFNGMAINVTN